MALTEKQIEYVRWRATPNRSGTKTQWAKDHSVDMTTLRAWEKTSWYEDELNDALSEMALGGDSVLEVIHSIQRAAAGGDQQAAKTYLAFLEKTNPTKNVARESRAVELLSDAELDEAWAEARAV